MWQKLVRITLLKIVSMSKFVINGGKELSGSITVAGSKNSALPLLAATLLTDRDCEISNVPDIEDVRNFLVILDELGARSEFENGTVRINCGSVDSFAPNEELTKTMRASVVLMGALLGRFGSAQVAYPGGDKIGKRPIDFHIRAFQSLGATVVEGDLVALQAKKLIGSDLYAESSVTATENMILASVQAEGNTTIKLAALEPHVQQLCEFLNIMGAKISGIGTHTLNIAGAISLQGAEIEVTPDMIEAGTFAVLGAASHSAIEIRNVRHDHMDAVYEKFRRIGVSFDKDENSLIINKPQNEYKAVEIKTGVYPALATDLQPPFGVMATQCRGVTKIHDWIHEGRLGYLDELSKMGASIKKIDTHRAEISGPAKLAAAKIKSLDLRSGITLVIAALIAGGTSEISGVEHIDRGYENLEKRLTAIGGDIKRV